LLSWQRVVAPLAACCLPCPPLSLTAATERDAVACACCRPWVALRRRVGLASTPLPPQVQRWLSRSPRRCHATRNCGWCHQPGAYLRSWAAPAIELSSIHVVSYAGTSRWTGEDWHRRAVRDDRTGLNMSRTCGTSTATRSDLVGPSSWLLLASLTRSLLACPLRRLGVRENGQPFASRRARAASLRPGRPGAWYGFDAAVTTQRTEHGGSG